MKIMGIDPSSTATGWAIIKGLHTMDLDAYGIIKPPSGKTQHPSLPTFLREHLADKRYHAFCRTLYTLEHLPRVACEAPPDLIVVEIPSGLIGTGAKRGARGSLTSYGFAAGAIFATLHCIMPPAGRVLPVTERHWIGRNNSKLKRQLEVASLYGQYDRKYDRGGDASDAISLARWGMRNMGAWIGGETGRFGQTG